MDYVEMISQLGFPIVCVLGLAWYVNKMTSDFQKTVIEMYTKHYDEVSELKDAINNLALKLEGKQDL
jgi:hypothetical protein